MPTSSTPIGATPVATALGGAPTQTAPAARPDSLGKDAFLKLLVAQLRYQDPSSPADSSQFMSQTAQFTQVEKLEEIAKASTDMLAAQGLLASSTLVGRTVTYADPDGNDVSGVVTSARFGPEGPVLRVGPAGSEVAVSAIKEIRQDTPASTAPSTTPTPTA
jgi:flagellar basal-body rod modification protein FlgD